jgi:hypothetical protein
MSTINQTSLSSVSICKQPSHKAGLIPADPPLIEVSAGAASPVAFESAQLLAASTDDASFVGYILECVEATNPENLWLRRMIKRTNFAGAEFECDGFPAVIAMGDKFRLYQTPDAPFVCTTAGVAAVTIACAGRTEAIDYWNGNANEGGCYLEAIRSGIDETPGDYHPLITDWAFAGTTVTVDTITPGAKSVGDLYRAVRHLDVTAAAMVAEESPPIIREGLLGADGRDYSVPGRRAASAALDMVFRGPGTGRDGLKTELHDLLDCVFTSVEPADSTTGAVAHALTHYFGTAPGVVGRMLLSPWGDAFMVESIAAANQINVTPDLRHLPPAAGGDVMLGGWTYTPAQLVRFALSLYGWRGNSIEIDAYGGVPAFTISGAKGEQLKVGVAIQFADWVRRTTNHVTTVPGTADAAERLWTPR